MLNVGKSPLQETIPCVVVRDVDIVELTAQMNGAWGIYEKVSSKNRMNLVIFGRDSIQEMASIYGTFCYIEHVDKLNIEIGNANELPDVSSIISLVDWAYDIPFAVPDDIDFHEEFCVPDCIGATHKGMKYLDTRKQKGKYEIEERKLSEILNMLFFITDETLNVIGYEKERDIVLLPEKSEQAARDTEQMKQSFATIF